jgi:hypothetical protein
MPKRTSQHNLSVANPKLAQEWHPSKNGVVTPKDVTISSGKKVWWQCKKGHEWTAVISSRPRCGCPYCGNKKVCKDNCLSTRNPNLAKEWHPSKNGELTPQNVTSGCGKKIWWLCGKGHEWESAVDNRNKGQDCPYCTGKKACIDNCLATLNPELVKEWHPSKNGNLLPTQFTPGSKIKVWWICSKNKHHEWNTMILHRSRKNSGCPFCSGHKASQDDNFKLSAPHLDKEFDYERNYPLTPEELRPFSSRQVWWVCQKNNKEHRWLAPVASRTGGNGCPYCNNRLACTSNSLQTVRPDLAKRWHPFKNGALTPTSVVAGGHKKIWWQCQHGHEWQAPIKSRMIQVLSCPKCKPNTSLMELRVFTELKWLFGRVEFHKKEHGVECDVFVPDLKLAVEIDGYFWHRAKQEKDKNKNVILNKHGISLIRLREQLPKISEYDVVYKYRDKHYDVIKQLLEHIQNFKVCPPETEKLINHYLIEGRLKNDQEFKQLWNQLPAPHPGTSLREKNERVAREWHPTRNGQLNAADVTNGSSRIVWWQCEKDHEWKAAVARRSSGDNCPYCSGHKVCKDNCLATLNPMLAKEWHPIKNGTLTPNDVTPGSSCRKVWWRCVKGHEWEMKPLARMYGSGCPFCAGKRACNDNCLATVNPQLAIEWHPSKNGTITPRDVTPGSGKKFWWKCKNGHEYQMRVLHRSHGSGCSYCIGRRASYAYCLASKNPDLAKKWHPTNNGALTPKDVTPGSNKNVWWICTKGHEWEATIKSRHWGNSCPYCRRKKGT